MHMMTTERLKPLAQVAENEKNLQITTLMSFMSLWNEFAKLAFE